MTNANKNGQNKQERKTTMKTTNNTMFADLLRTYEQQVHNRQQTPDTETAYTQALTNLATAVAYSVLEKCIDTSGNPTLTRTRQSLARDLHNLDRIRYANDNACHTDYTADGDYRTTIADKDLHSALDKLLVETIGDGLDLVHDAICIILAETAEAEERNNGVLPECWTETPYQVRRLNRKIWIKTADSVNGWETVTTTPIQEMYKAVRRAVSQSRAMQTDPRNGYTYLADISTDPDSGLSETIYRRYGKYADIGGAVTDYNGKEIAYTADEQTAYDIDDLVERLNLTAKQAKVLQLRLSGYGDRAIATYLGVTLRAVQKTRIAIQTKADAIGLTPVD